MRSPLSTHYTEWARSKRLRAEGSLRPGIQDYDIADMKKLSNFKKMLEQIFGICGAIMYSN